MKAALATLLTAGALALARPAAAQTPLVKESPFASANAPAPAAVSAEPFQLIGVSVSADKSRVCLYEAAAKHSRWITVGATAGDIEVVSYDPAQKQAVVSIAGKKQTLRLRESAAGEATVSPSTPEGKARDARLLTGDLLDIGQQQRKAYADAHKAASN